MDGLRALAALAILVFHLDPAWLSGGFIGVDIFFVISGFLITGQIVDQGPDFRFRAFYRRRVMLNHGFSERVLSMAEVENQQPGEATPTSQSPALIAYVRMIGLEAGDTAHIVLRAPVGTVIAEKLLPALERGQAQTLTLIGRKRPGASWPAGTYLAEYQVTNAGQTVFSQQFSMPMGPVRPGP